MRKRFIIGVVGITGFLTVALSGHFFCLAEAGQREQIQKLQPEIDEHLKSIHNPSLKGEGTRFFKTIC